SALLLPSASAFAQSGQMRFDSTALAAAVQSAAQQSSESVRRLTMDEAVRLALEQNLGIRIQRLDPQIQDVPVLPAQSLWAPNLTSNLSRQSQTLQPTSTFSGSGSNILNGTMAGGVGLNQILPWGAQYSANWANQRLTTTSLAPTFSPQLISSVNLQYSQPLLRNYSIDQIRQNVLNSKKYRDLSDIQLQAVIVQTTRSVRNAYWDLVYAINNLKAQQQSLALSQQFLKDNQKRVEIGTLAPIDIVQAQAEVASNESGVIVADAAIKTAQDNLRSLILDPGAA